MRRSVLLFAALGSALALTACGDAADSDADVDTDTTVAATDTAVDMDDGTVINPNDATVEELAAMDGISDELAAAIVAGQPYNSASAFNTALLGSVGEAEAATIRERLFVPVNLNTASEEDIALIPGMTDKMQGEFLEYRPYGEMSDFDREIGKYVDADEVERFKRYVTL